MYLVDSKTGLKQFYWKWLLGMIHTFYKSSNARDTIIELILSSLYITDIVVFVDHEAGMCTNCLNTQVRYWQH